MKLALILLLFSVFVASSLAIRFPNPQQHHHHESELEQCLEKHCQGLRGRPLIDCARQCPIGEGEGEERGRRRGGGGGYDELIDAMMSINGYSHHDDPKKRYDECRQECRQSQRHEGQCLKGCQERYQQEREGGQGRGHGRQDDDDEEEVELIMRPSHHGEQGRGSDKCERICQGKGYECQRKCRDEERRRRSHGRGGGGGHRDDDEEEEEDDFVVLVSSRRDPGPESRYEECQQSCRQQRQGQRCESECQKKYSREQRSRGHGGRHYEEEVEYDEDESDRRGHHHRDPKRRFMECQERCHRQGQRGYQGQQCVTRCQEQYRKQHRREYEGSDDGTTILASILELTRVLF